MIEAQFEDGVDLLLAEAVAAVGQAGFAADQDAEAFDLVRVKSNASSLTRASSRLATAADDPDELVHVGQRDQVTFERFGAVLGLAATRKRVRRKTTSRRCSM